MKKTISLLFTPALVGLLFISCSDPEFEDSGKIQLKDKTYSFTGFTAVTASSGFDIYITPGATFSIAVSGDSRNLADLNIETITDDLLLIEYTNLAKRQHRTTVNITMPTVRAVAVSAVSIAHIDGFYDTPVGNLDISASSHAGVFFNGIADTIYAHAVDYSMIDLSGSGSKVDAYVASDSQLDAFYFPVEDARVEVVMESGANVNASDKLYAKVATTSEVLYKGSPVITSLVDGSSIFGPN